MPDVISTDGIILAAGASSRAGAFKPALPIGGKPLIARCIEGMYEACQRIIVVGGYEIEHLRRLVEAFDKVECVENPSYRKGMFTSVKVGLSMVRGYRCFVLPADIPLVPPSVYRSLLALNADIVVPTFHEKNGHPVCFSKAIIPHILRGSDDSSLREIIRAVGYRTIEVDAEEILMDVDTPQDYEAICQRFAERPHNV